MITVFRRRLRNRLQDCLYAEGMLLISRLGYVHFKEPRYGIIVERIDLALRSLYFEVAVLRFLLSFTPPTKEN